MRTHLGCKRVSGVFRILLALPILWAFAAPAARAQAFAGPAAARPVQTDRAGRPIFGADGARLDHARGSSDVVPPADEPAVMALAPGGVQEGPYSMRLDEAWRSSIWGTSIGRAGMIPADLDGDGKLELVMGTSIWGGFSGSSSWMIVRHAPATLSYEIVWSSPPSQATVTRIEVHRIGTTQIIFVGLSNGALQVWDGRTRVLLRTVQVATSSIGSILYDDADNDGSRELVVATGQSIHLLDPVSFVERSAIPRGAGEIAIGNVDADAAREIVLVSGPVLQYDGTTATEEWSFGVFGSAAYLALGDLDADGMDEIVTARGWDYIDVYGGDLRSPRYQILSDLDIQALLIADVNRDGRPEVLYGDGQWGSIYAHEGATGRLLWEIPNPEHGTTRIAVGDVDADGELEVMWGAGWTSTGPDHFYVHGIQSRAREFESPDIVGPFAAVALGDADDDGVDEIVAVSWESDSGYADGVVHVFDAETYALEWRSGSQLFGGFAWTGVHDVAIGDVDRDGASEIVIATDRLYDGRIFVLDGKTRAIERQLAFDSGSPMLAVELADVDGNGTLEIVAANGAAHTGSPGTFVYVIDGLTGATIWKSVSLGFNWSGVYALDVEDLDGGGRPEIVASLDGLVVVDGESRLLMRSTRTDVRAIEIADLDGNGRAEIWAGTEDGELLRFDPTTLVATSVARLCDGSIESLVADRVAVLDGSIQFSCGDDLGVYGLAERAVVWRSPALGAYVGYADNLQVAERDARALLIAGTQFGVVAFSGYGLANRDVDGDGIANHRDNCPEVANPDQRDADADGVGDACNDAFDADGDEWADERDVCPQTPDAGQADADGDGTGDACNQELDRDGDEWADLLDNCKDVGNADQANRDGDEVGDVCDRYPDNPDNYAARCDEAVANETLLGAELLECRARLPLDADGDGEADPSDACPATPPGSAIDQAGCSQAQYCGSVTGSGILFGLRCLASDFRNDEPLILFPDDCRTSSERTSKRSLTFRCVAR